MNPDEQYDSMEQTMDELQNQVTVLRGGCQRLSSEGTDLSNRVENLTDRVGGLESKMDSMNRLLEKIAEQTCPDLAKGKGVADRAGPSIQVSDSNDPKELVEESLGHRRTLGVFESRQSLLKKIELPTFDGFMPYGWIRQTERYFRTARYTEEEKLELVALSLTGPVLNWYSWEAVEEPFQDWRQFKKRLLDRFALSMDDEPGNRLCALRQTGSIQKYVSEFEELITQVTGIDEANLVNKFYTGLKHEMKEVIRLKEPKGLRNHIAAVIKMESSVLCQMLGERVPVKNKESSTPTPKYQKNHTTTIRVVPTGDDKTKTSEAEKNDPQRQRLSPAELAELKRLKLCFKCREKWFRGHLCGKAELKVFMLVEGFELEVNEAMWDEEVLLREADATQLMELSLYSFLGIKSPTTHKLRGKIGKTEFVVLIDSGATHNFVSPQLIHKANMKVDQHNNLQVLLGTGISVAGLGVCRHVPIELQGLKFDIDCISLELGKVDLVLGVQWLRTLGRCEVDWEF